MYNFCYKKTEEYAQYLRCPEQAVFDFMIQEFDLNICNMDPNIYCVHPSKANKIDNFKIIHSYGQRKFWNEINNENWNSNYTKWLKMSGTKYNLKKYLVKKWFKILLKKIGIYENIKKLLLNFKTKYFT
jgi:hypothetical protein